MSINTQTLFDQKALQYGTGASTTRFSADFIQAVNRALSDFVILVGPAPAAITAVSQDVDLDAKYEPTLSFAVDYYMLSIGGYNNRDTLITKRQYDDALRGARMEYHRRDVSVDGSAGLKGKFGDLSAQ